MSTEFDSHVVAFEQTVRSTIELASGFGTAEWRLPTDCPGWSVQDVVAHLVSLEVMLLGDPLPDHELPDLPHVKNDMARVLEIGVDVRRPLPGEAVLAELRETLDRRLAQIPGLDPEGPAALPDGRPGTTTEFLMFRAFDCWIHEQDIRRAVGVPGNLDAPAGRCAWTILSRGLPMVTAKRGGALPGQSAVFAVGDREAAVLVDAGGRASRGPVPAEPTVRLAMSFETYTLLAAGRRGPADAVVEVTGDAELGARILAGMGVTP
ncbi:maleylpyruvate isomerase family mycothiol-dependent enzyme [Actinocorallia longicatena]|uniref:Maleylpyruvate isomerase family mycothiol-dependent enzyme n=1 Tax=Actinocorallia longicatena TaxID=111803 RepID=A0ABP6PYE8_9ACTN